MALNTPYRLSETISATVLMIWMAVFMLMKDNARRIPWNPGTMQVPVMPCIPALNGHIVLIHRDNIEIPWIYRL